MSDARRAVRAALLAASAAVVLIGCAQPLGFLAQAAFPQKIKAVFPIEDRPTLIMVDDPQIKLGSLSVSAMIVDRLMTDLRNAKAVTQFIPPEDLSQYAVGQGERYSKTPIVQVGRALGAQQVIYIKIEQVSIASEPGLLRPSSRVQVKLIDVPTGKRIFPPEDDEPAYAVITQTRDRYQGDAGNRGDVSMMMRKLATLIGRDVSRVFYEHLPRQPGEPYDQ